MGKKSRKKKLDKDFKKVKLKIGRTLKKSQSTDTNIRTKKMVILEQLPQRQSTDSTTNPLSHRKLSLLDLLTQLGHHNKNSRKDALIGIKQLLVDHPCLILPNLRTMLPALSRLITDDECSSTQQLELKVVIELVCRSTDSSSISPHFGLLLAHLTLGLSHLSSSIKLFSLSCLNALLHAYPELCLSSADLFSSYSAFLASEGRKTTIHRVQVFDSLNLFVHHLTTDDSTDKSDRTYVLKIAFGTDTNSHSINLLPRIAPFDLPILSTINTDKMTSPLDSVDNLIKIWDSVSTIIIDSLIESTQDRPDLEKILPKIIKSFDLLVEKTNKVLTRIGDCDDGDKLKTHLGKLWSKSTRRRLAPISKGNRTLIQTFGKLDRIIAVSGKIH